VFTQQLKGQNSTIHVPIQCYLATRPELGTQATEMGDNDTTTRNNETRGFN